MATDHKPRVEHRTGGSNLWATPRDFAANVLRTLKLPPIALDLAAEASTTLAPRWYGPGGEREDAMGGKPWAAPDGTRWLNPPYSRQCCVCPDRVWRKRGDVDGSCSAKGHHSTDIGGWMDRVGIEGRHPGAVASPIVALVPASTDVAWWHLAMQTVAEVHLVAGRLRFLAPTGPLGALAPAETGAASGSAVLVWTGPRAGIPPRFGAVTSAGLMPEQPWHGHGRGVAA